MRRRMMKSKIHRATVTGANLHYVGSVSIDTELLALADILPYEQVTVLDIDNGARFETYAIEGERGQICLNGAAARLVAPGDKVIIITYADYERAELETLPPPRRARGRPEPRHRRGVGPTRRRAHADRTRVTTRARPGPFDVLVLGSGVAGLSAAVRLAGPGGPSPSLSLGVLTKGVLSQSATRWAQGGVAAVLGADEDSTDLHLADTLAAGAGLCDEEAVRILVDEGPGRVHELIALGVEFDREATGSLALAREGGHSRPRVVHAGGAATGAEVERALVDATYRSASAVLEGWFALDLLVEGGRCVGVLALPPGGGDGPVAVRADHVVLATGGAGQLFSVTTNPPESTGDGVAMALRAGVPTADVEFVQFHPTALASSRHAAAAALRGVAGPRRAAARPRRGALRRRAGAP